MKSKILTAAIGAALALGACAHAPAETASLTPDQIRAELATISAEISEINAASREDYRLERVEARAASFAQRAGPSVASDPTADRRKLMTRTVPYTKLRALNDRRDQLLAQLARVDQAQN